MKRQKMITVVLGILLVLAMGYIVLGKYSDWKESRRIEVFQQGAQYGYEQAVIQVAEMAEGCESVPLRLENNQTVNVVSIECLGNSS